MPFIATLALNAKNLLPEKLDPIKYNERKSQKFNALQIGSLIANLYLGCLEATHNFYFDLNDATVSKHKCIISYFNSLMKTDENELINRNIEYYRLVSEYEPNLKD